MDPLTQAAALADIYDAVTRQSIDTRGYPPFGPRTAEHLLELAAISADQAELMARADDTVSRRAFGICRLRHVYDTHVGRFTALEVPEVRSTLARGLDTGDVAGEFAGGHPMAAAHAAAVRASAWFVTAEACDLVDDAALQMPDWTLSADDVPDDSEVVVFARPELDADADWVTGVPHWVNAISYRVFTDRGDRVVMFGEFSAYRDPGGGLRWLCSSRFSWKIGAALDDMSDQHVDDTLDLCSSTSNVVVGRRRIACLWALAATPRVLERSELDVPRPDRRRAQRDGMNAAVALFDVRRSERPGGPAENRSVQWTHRWRVSGHWRQQPHGPGGQLRKPTWVAEHIKGPDGLPLVDKNHVGVVRGGLSAEP